MEISSADFTKLTLQKVADILLDHDANGVICKGLVDGKMYSLKVELVCDELKQQVLGEWNCRKQTNVVTANMQIYTSHISRIH